MANTYTLISSVTVGSGGASSIDFTSIPATYTDLLVVLSGRTNRATYTADNLTPKFNTSTANFTFRALSGDGNVTYSDTSYIPAFTASAATANTFSNVLIYVPNYTSSNYKSISIDSVTEHNGTTAYANLSAGLWSQTAAITSFGLQSATSSTIQQYSTAYLYGIKNS